MTQPGDIYFTPSNKYVPVSREFYETMKEDILRIQTSITIEEARANCVHILDKLKKRFEGPAAQKADLLKDKLTAMSEAAYQEMLRSQRK